MIRAKPILDDTVGVIHGVDSAADAVEEVFDEEDGISFPSGEIGVGVFGSDIGGVVGAFESQRRLATLASSGDEACSWICLIRLFKENSIMNKGLGFDIGP